MESLVEYRWDRIVLLAMTPPSLAPHQVYRGNLFPPSDRWTNFCVTRSGCSSLGPDRIRTYNVAKRSATQQAKPSTQPPPVARKWADEDRTSPL